jgi:hypothetical protein
MRRIRSLALLALLASGSLATRAYAGQIYGKFTLPFDTRWGVATLPAGDYTFSLSGPGGMLQLHRGIRTVALLQSQSYNHATSGQSVLVLMEERGLRSVRELRLPGAGLVFYYVPGKLKRGSAQEERQIGQQVPVWTYGEPF